MRELQLARRSGAPQVPGAQGGACQLDALSGHQHQVACEHRSVSKDGRIVCQKIVEGDPEVSPNVCRDCPFKQINCAHLRFSLRVDSPSPLVVRFNGRTEVWDDGPPRLSLERAACTERVVPIHGPLACANCPARLPLGEPAVEPRSLRPSVAAGKVVFFPAREAVAAAG
jgi:hypothetical protein